MGRWPRRAIAAFLYRLCVRRFPETAWREDDAPAPLSVYGASKLAGEPAIMNAGGRHLIVRTSWVYAAQGKNFLRTMARLAGERKELRVVADRFGAPTSARIFNDRVGRRFGALVPALFWVGSLVGMALWGGQLYAGSKIEWPMFWLYIVFGIGNVALA